MKKAIPFTIILALAFFYVWNKGFLPQNQAYYNFADQRSYLGIPNFFDTVTNIFFLIPGLIGFLHVLHHRPEKSFYSWLTLFAGVFLVAFGSGYFHLTPNDATLVWDRLPMTIGFMGIFSAIISEAIDFPFEKYFLIPLLIIGAISVFVWKWTGDLRFYYFIQLAPIVTIPAVLLIFPKRYTLSYFFLFALAFYIGAKIVEDKDLEIYNVLSFSGHSIKHILAAMAPFVFYIMLMKRKKKL